MAVKRMFSTQITSSDAFLDLPSSSQALYFHLCLAADDDGVINRPKSIARQVGAAQDDLRLLIAKRFLLAFEDEGVVVVKHWRMHNTVQKDRYKPSEYREVMALLEEKENKSYTLREPAVSRPDTDCIQSVSVVQSSPVQVSTVQTDCAAGAEPTLSDVEEFCLQRGLVVRPRRFWRYYSDRNWKTQDGRPIDDWQALLLRWDKQDRGEGSDEIDPLVLRTLENMGVTG